MLATDRSPMLRGGTNSSVARPSSSDDDDLGRLRVFWLQWRRGLGDLAMELLRELKRDRVLECGLVGRVFGHRCGDTDGGGVILMPVNRVNCVWRR